ncbi:hypothetical protein BGZ65_012359, partial [Modicella reniformis]
MAEYTKDITSSEGGSSASSRGSQPKPSRQEPFPRARTSAESTQVVEGDHLKNQAGISPTQRSVQSMKVPSTCLPMQSVVDMVSQISDDSENSIISIKRSTSGYPSPVVGGTAIRSERHRGSGAYSDEEKDIGQLQSSTVDTLVRVSITRPVPNDGDPVEDNAIPMITEPATALPNFSRQMLAGSQIPLKGYVPYDPQPWTAAIAEHQAKTIQNFHAISQALDNINAELQFIFSEFLTRQYEQIDESLKADHEHIMQLEQEQ